MYPKIIFEVLKAILQIFISFLKMCENLEHSKRNYSLGKFRDEVEIYNFRPFKYEEIIPNPCGKIPLPRSGHRIGADSSNFYSFGGYNPLNPPLEDQEDLVHSYPLFQELWKFNFASKTWFKYPNSKSLPVELASNALVLYGNLLMVYGGTGSPFGYRCSNQLYVCKVNEENGKMVEIQAWGKFPSPLYGQALVYHNEYLYTIGGTTGLSYTCDIHKLNLKTNEWVDVFLSKGENNGEPEGRYRHEVAFDGKSIYILGGGTAELVYDFNDIPTFNLDQGEWSNTKTYKDNKYGYPAPRRCHGAVQIYVDNVMQVFVTGGHDGENIFDDLWRLDFSTFSWTCFSECRLPKEIYFHAASSTPAGRLYVFGGIYSDAESYNRTNAVYSTWLCIPKLSEICWEAVLLYFPHIVDCDQEVLVNLGFPRSFIKRLPNKS